MSEERFYNHVREKLFDYSPEVPQAVYSGMRRKLWWSGFTSFKAYRFNMWYLLLMVGGASATLIYSTKENTDSIATKAGTFESRSWEPQLANATAGCESATTSCCASLEQTGSCVSASGRRSSTKSNIVEVASFQIPNQPETVASPSPEVIGPSGPNNVTAEVGEEISPAPINENPTQPENAAPAVKKETSTKRLVVTEYIDSKGKSVKKK